MECVGFSLVQCSLLMLELMGVVRLQQASRTKSSPPGNGEHACVCVCVYVHMCMHVFE